MLTISFEDVTQRFRGRTIFAKINQKLQSGQITVVTGPNGSGKSTMLKLAGKLLMPSEGRVLAAEDGVVLRRGDFRSRMAMVTPHV